MPNESPFRAEITDQNATMGKTSINKFFDRKILFVSSS